MAVAEGAVSRDALRGRLAVAEAALDLSRRHGGGGLWCCVRRGGVEVWPREVVVTRECGVPCKQVLVVTGNVLRLG